MFVIMLMLFCCYSYARFSKEDTYMEDVLKNQKATLA